MPLQQKILIVDDLPANLKVMQASLCRVDAEIMTAASGADALALVLQHNFCLILLDVQMPEMDGFEVAKFLQQEPSSANIPIIFVTALERDEKYISQGYLSGAVDYLSKPIDIPILLAKVNIFIKLAKTKQQLEVQKNMLEQAVADRTVDLVQALDQAEAANKAKSQFLANISHEFRTPLHAILSFSQLGLNKIKHHEFDKVEKFLTNIHSSGKRLSSLVEDLLDLSKYQAGQMKMDINKHDLVYVLKACTEEISPLINEKKLSLEINTPERILINFDNKNIHQVIINLLSNAIKFSEPDSTIKISLTQVATTIEGITQHLIELIVEDNGLGIPTDELSDIFNPFIQSSLTDTKAGGTGLGLSICKEIVEAHDGRIWAENLAEKGSAFHIQLPLSRT